MVKALLTFISTMSSRFSRLRNARTNACDEEEPELLHVAVAVKGPG
jgi:hypothetical protein